LEGASAKVSRKQAIIQMREVNKFILMNVGRHPIYVDGNPAFNGEAVQLFDQSVVQVNWL